MVLPICKESTGYIEQNIVHLIEKQEKYLATLSATDSYDLNDIDYIHLSFKMSLHQMIMGLKLSKHLMRKMSQFTYF